MTERQHAELLSLAGYPQIALDDEAAAELAQLGLVEHVLTPGRRTKRYRFTDAGRAALPEEQHARLAETERLHGIADAAWLRLAQESVFPSSGDIVKVMFPRDRG